MRNVYQKRRLRGFLATVALLLSGAVTGAVTPEVSDGNTSPPASPIAPVFYENDYIASLDYGLICTLKRSGGTKDANTATGSTHIITGTPSFAARTTIIPAQIGLSFGVRVRAVGPGKLRNVVMSLRHPATGAGSRKTTFESWPATITTNNPPTTSSFTFEAPHELALGRWIFEARKDDQVLYHVEFNVVAPARAQRLVRLCAVSDPSR